MEQTELTLEQAKKADAFLKELLDKNGIDGLKVLSFFKSKDEAFFIARYLEKLGFVNLVGSTYSSPFNLITANGGIEMLMENGGLTKKASEQKNKHQKQTEREELEISLAKSNIEANELNKRIARKNEKNEKFNRISTIMNILIGILNVLLLLWQILKDRYPFIPN